MRRRPGTIPWSKIMRKRRILSVVYRPPLDGYVQSPERSAEPTRPKTSGCRSLLAAQALPPASSSITAVNGRMIFDPSPAAPLSRTCRPAVAPLHSPNRESLSRSVTPSDQNLARQAFNKAKTKKVLPSAPVAIPASLPAVSADIPSLVDALRKSRHLCARATPPMHRLALPTIRETPVEAADRVSAKRFACHGSNINADGCRCQKMRHAAMTGNPGLEKSLARATTVMSRHLRHHSRTRNRTGQADLSKKGGGIKVSMCRIEKACRPRKKTTHGP